MQIQVISSNYIEPWSFENPDKQGIGGSETCHIEYAWRLAQRGHQVVSYAPVPFSGEATWRGSVWTHFSNADYTRAGLWIIFRAPEQLDNFPLKHPRQTLVHVNQDTFYYTASEARYKKADKVVCLCRDHAADVETSWACLKGKIVVSRNGLRGDLIDEVLGEGIPRNPKKVVYTSSPDRGLKTAVQVCERAREYIPDLELHTYYGLDNIETMANTPEQKAKAYFSGRVAKDFKNFMAKHPWVDYHGRVPQRELYRELASASVLLYPTSFHETGHISGMEAQALGAIPITNPLWAMRDYTLHGFLIDGNPEDPLVRARYAAELVRMLGPEGAIFQDTFRDAMMREARQKFDWDGAVDILEEACGIRQEVAIA